MVIPLTGSDLPRSRRGAVNKWIVAADQNIHLNFLSAGVSRSKPKDSMSCTLVSSQPITELVIGCM
jgi:hypothetical protein